MLPQGFHSKLLLLARQLQGLLTPPQLEIVVAPKTTHTKTNMEVINEGITVCLELALYPDSTNLYYIP